MDSEDIIRMAQEAGWGLNNSCECSFVKAQLKFAELVAAAEREACAKVCEQEEIEGSMSYGEICAASIRARGSQ